MLEFDFNDLSKQPSSQWHATKTAKIDSALARIKDEVCI
jgi:hypothetical protein